MSALSKSEIFFFLSLKQKFFEQVREKYDFPDISGTGLRIKY